MKWIFQGYGLLLCIGVSVAQVQYESGGYLHCSPATCTNGRCQWSFSGYECVCRPGYQKFRGSTGFCVDRNECNVRPAMCPDGVCINYMGTYECKCNRGFKQSPNKKQCVYDPNIPFTNTWGFQEFLTSMGYDKPQRFLAPDLKSHYSSHQSVYIVPPVVVPTTTPRPFARAPPGGRRHVGSWNVPTELQRPNFLTSNNVLPAGKSSSYQSDAFSPRAAYYLGSSTHKERYPINMQGSPPKFEMNMLRYNTPNAFPDQSQTSSQTQFTSQIGQQQMQSKYNVQPQTWATPNAMLQSSQPYVPPSQSHGVHNWAVPTRDPKDTPGVQHQPVVTQHQQTRPMTGAQQQRTSNTPLSYVYQQHQRTRQYWSPRMLNRIPVAHDSDRQYYNQYQSTDTSYSSPYYPGGTYGLEHNQYNTMGNTPTYHGQYNPYDSYQPDTKPRTTYNAPGNKQSSVHDTAGSGQDGQHIQTAINSNNSPHPALPDSVTDTPITASPHSSLPDSVTDTPITASPHSALPNDSVTDTPTTASPHSALPNDSVTDSPITASPHSALPNDSVTDTPTTASPHSTTAAADTPTPSTASPLPPSPGPHGPPSPGPHGPPSTTHPPPSLSSPEPPHASTDKPHTTSTDNPHTTSTDNHHATSTDNPHATSTDNPHKTTSSPTPTTNASPPTPADGQSTTTAASSPHSNNTTPLPNTSASIVTLPSATDITSDYAAAEVTPPTPVGSGDTGQNVQIKLDVDLASFPEVITPTAPLSHSASQGTKQNQQESTLIAKTVVAAEATAITEDTYTPTTTLSPFQHIPVVNDVMLLDILNQKRLTESSNAYPMYPSAPATSNNYHPTSGTSNTVYSASPAKRYSVDYYSQTHDNRISPDYYRKSQQRKRTYTAEQNVRDIQPLQQQTIPANMQAYIQPRSQIYPAISKYQSRYGSQQNSGYNYNVPSYYYNPNNLYTSPAMSPPTSWYNLPQTRAVRSSNSLHAYLRDPYRRPSPFFGRWNRHSSSRAPKRRFMATDPSPSDDIMLAFVLSNAFK